MLTRRLLLTPKLVTLGAEMAILKGDIAKLEARASELSSRVEQIGAARKVA
jgi:hypothetical protein